MRPIRFGTDGWRGIIADDFTFDNVARVAQALADYHNQAFAANRGIVIGYDTRFLSTEFARTVAEVLVGNNIPVIFAQSDVPTQAVSWAVVDRKVSQGVVITASHNPASFNGIKIKSSFGGSATEDVTGKIESFLDKNPVKMIAWDTAEKKGLLVSVDLLSSYVDKVRSFLDMNVINSASLNIVCDPMYGVGDGILARILAGSNCNVSGIHPKPNPGFGGINPEPIEKYLTDLSQSVSGAGADLGLATDGDADRVGIVDNTGRYLSPLQVYALLLLYLVEERDLDGLVAKTVSLGYQPERICRKFGLQWEQTPVGFKYIAHQMVTGGVVFGGEESGGYGYSAHMPERDGILSALLFVEMTTRKDMTLSEILDGMERKFGKSLFKRVDFIQEGTVNKRQMVERLVGASLSALGSVPVKEVITIDGAKFVMEDESWLLLRPSGTEPKIRVYAEASRETQLDRIIEEGKELITGVVGDIVKEAE